MSNLNYDDDIYRICVLNNDYLEETAKLLNSEWPRSLNERMNSLKYSLDNHNNDLPLSLLYVKNDDNSVVGHLNYSLIELADQTKAYYLQSLIINNSYRNKGLGKKFVKLCENYLINDIIKKQQSSSAGYTEPQPSSSDNSNVIYLNTKDKQYFYESLGYQRTEPILFYPINNKKSSNFNNLLKNLFSSMNQQNNTTNVLPSQTNKNIFKLNNNCDIDINIDNGANNQHVTWYKKQLLVV